MTHFFNFGHRFNFSSKFKTVTLSHFLIVSSGKISETSNGKVKVQKQWFEVWKCPIYPNLCIIWNLLLVITQFTLNNFSMPAIINNLRKIEQTDFCPIYPIFGITKFLLKNPKLSLEAIFNICHWVPLQKNLKTRFRQEF